MADFAELERLESGAAEGVKVGPPKVGTRQELDALAPGTEFIDPHGTKRTKPYVVKQPGDIANVPEGGTFVDPTGQTRTRPTYDPIDFGDQVLIDLARGNERQIEAILRGQYGAENVKRELGTNELYVEKDGKRLKPNRGSVVRRGLANTLGVAAPVGLGTAGGILGGVAGIPALGVGVAPGSVIGAGIGGVAGEAFNQSVLALMGYGATPGEYARTVALGGAESAAGQGAGELIGRGVAGAINKTGAAKEAASGLPGTIGRFLGAQPAETEQAARLAGQGVMVPPSAWLKEAPYPIKVVETFDPAFRQQNVLQQSAKAYYDKTAPELLEKIGVKPPAGSITGQTSPVSVEPFGAAMLAKAQSRLAAKDQQLDAAIKAAREQILARAPSVEGRQATLAALQKAEQEARVAAQEVVDNGFRSIQQDMDNAIKVAGAGENPGDMVRLADEKIRALRQAVSSRATKMYDAADAAAGDAVPDITMLRVQADEFMAQLPEEFKGRYPSIIEKITTMNKGVTFGQLHNLRTQLRMGVDYNDLTPDVREGALKKFVGEINQVLFDKEAPPQLQEAGRLLREADSWYGQNISQFRAKSVKWIADQLEAGVPADPKTLARTIFQPGQTEEIQKVRQIVGPPMWSAIQAADTNAMIEQSRTLIPGEIDGSRFASLVLDRERDGLLTSAYDKATADRLREQARNIMTLNGKIPVQVNAGDTLSTLVRRADSIAAEIKQMAERDPIKLLTGELKRFDSEVKKIKGQFASQRRASPLHFLENQNAGPIEAANRILNKPDLIMAVARDFGEQSPEFEMLRQTWATRLFQRTLPNTGKLAPEFAENIPPEVQQLMFPGVALQDAQQLAKDMQFLLPAIDPDTGGSMAAASRVLHPLSSSPKILSKAIGQIPGADPAARWLLNKYYSTMTWAITHPTFVKYVAAGLKGSPDMRNLVRREFMRSYEPWVKETYGAFGAALANTAPVPQERTAPPPKMAPTRSWRDLYKEKYGGP